MARRVVLHIGLMKSGTSFVQQVLVANREEVAARGLLFPMPWSRQVAAVKELADKGGPKQPARDPDGPLARLVAEVRAHEGTAVVSMEFLAPRPEAKIRELVDLLGAEELRVVVTVRDLARTIPAMWQESVQNWGRLGWEEYLEGVRREQRRRPGPGRSFWQRQDAATVVATWQEVVGRENVTVVTVPPQGAPPGLLWERFCATVPTDPAGFDLAVPSNPSLGLASLLALSGLNERLRDVEDPMSGRAYEKVVKKTVAKRGLAGRDEPRLGLDAGWVLERGERMLRELAALDPVVVGDLAELRPAPVRGSSPSEVTTGQQLEAALDALAIAVAELARRTTDAPGRSGKGGKGGKGGRRRGAGRGADGAPA